MADVKIVDINDEQWNIKDQESREKIATIEKDISTQNLPDVRINLINGYTCESAQIAEHYKAGKIHFAFIRIKDLKGDNIGTTQTIRIASTDLRPKKYTAFIARDYRIPTTVRCSLDISGTISIGESNGIKNGDNVIIGELIFAEP